ncbi:37S ribosomal protein S23, mitochondrial [Wickerhamomyces ciferrii]|uniref:Small ribosomal subunit protein mS29 n=1 Tax=Wickerhamomyces ciferrii (strain ATCC 14091 / BCRC 22168 / CBS 111 / JCM 3599 / NBRC 0793 / NRRL Y-1031 F-60-10) TaxID=1206466 RepID=K0KKB1_WICCF|nr:37S ribosomal protein S23, mitochondrial [Wickerhamomyces ciferrii]CCH45660.1 37S ribosomal protein S23, mitochondrial [Wickerhamomyces ciferrii]
MLRSVHFTSVRGFHSAAVLSAKAAAPVKKKAVHGYKKVGGGQSKKTSGVGKFFHEYVSEQKLDLKADELNGVDILKKSTKENTVVKYSQLHMKKLIIAGNFKHNQYRELFKTPITLVTKDTLKMSKFVENSIESSSKDNRICILGENGIGKSTLLGQTQALISDQGNSIILPIPYATQLVNGRNDYYFDKNLNTYIQPMYLKSFLHKIRTINQEILKKIPIQSEYSFEGNTRYKSILKATPKRDTLFELTNLRVTPRQRGKQLEAIINELSKQSEIPVFLTVDNFSAITSNPRTEYRDVNNSKIHVSKFQLSSLILDFAQGSKNFQKGGVILVTSTDDKPSPTLYAGLGLATVDPYTKNTVYDHEVASKLKGVESFDMSRFSKENVSSIVKKFIDAKIFNNNELKSNSVDSIINQKYILSGNGNPGELIKSILFLH